jgi:hypothetical protein
MAATSPVNRMRLPLLAVGTLVTFSWALAGHTQEVGDESSSARVLLRMVSDSATIGHYRFTVVERQQLVFDIAVDDPRRALLESATVPKQTTTDIAATIVSTPTAEGEDRRYIAYWLGYRVSGDNVQSLSAAQWDSIFQKVGRRAVLKFSPQAEPKGVEVVDAARPVGESLAEALMGLAMPLPADSVSEGSSWGATVAVTLTAPDGSHWVVPVRVAFRLRELNQGRDGMYARIEYDGEPVDSVGSATRMYGRYFGDSVFDVTHGRYDRMLAVAKLEVEWDDKSGLPPSRTLVEWQAQVIRR